MILRDDDWLRHPTAIVDTKTPNESFLRLASIYTKMGINNNAFHLSLLQPQLQGIDPFDQRLGDEEKATIALECMWNPWYALREVIRFPPQGGPTPIPYYANRGNIAMSWSFLNHIDFAYIQPRQTGKSGSTDALMITVMFLMTINTDIQLVTARDTLRNENIARLKSIRDLLPDYLNPTTRLDLNNTEAITCLARNNHYKTAVGQKIASAAEKTGRGLTSPIIHIDELPYIDNVHISLPAALSSGTAARDNVKKSGGMYGNIFTTTAGKKDTVEGRFSYEIIYNGMFWNEVLLDCFSHEELVETILRNSDSDTPMINGTFSHRQIGKTDAWLRQAIANARVNEEQANREYLNVWTSGTESSPLDPHLNEILLDSEIDPLYTEVTRDRYLLKWYIPEIHIEEHMNKYWHVVCLDSSNALGRDANGLTIMDVRDMGIKASAAVSEANLYRYAKWLANLLLKYPKTILVIENKSSAQGIIDTLLSVLPQHGHDPFKRIYNRVVEEKDIYPEAFREIQRPLSSRNEGLYLSYKGKFGFMTTGNSRALLYDAVLRQAARSTAHLVRDKVLSNEIRSLISKNGRVDHPVGGHDDVCVSWLLGHWFINHSKNLSYYGLNMNECLSLVSDNGAEITEEELVLRGVQAKTRLEIEDYKEKLKEAVTPGEVYRLEYLLAQKIKLAEADGGSTVNLDQILKEAKEERVKKSRLREGLRFYNNRKTTKYR